MMDLFQQLLYRRDACTDKDQVSGLVSVSMFEIVDEELGAGVSEEIRKEHKVPRQLIPLLKYPARIFLSALASAATRLYVKGWDYERTLKAVGARGTESFLDSPVGKTLVMLNGKSPDRLMRAAPLAYRTVYTYGERYHEARGPLGAAIHYTRELLGPSVQSGVLSAGIQYSCGIVPRVQITHESDNGLNFTLEVSWDEVK